ncbi:MAG TPA: histidine phosphatase family protein [Burkholderiaceae bacterium]|nr:histidine phosphatase family protein [Burkholderiaceae bacterium]
MDLILWRHAQAEDGTPDDARALTPRGEADAARVGAWLRERLPAGAATTVLCSPARRARRTADALGLPYGVSGALAPGADADEAIAETGWPEGREGTLVVVGHNPWIGRAAALLVAGRDGVWPIRKAGLWWLGWRARGGGQVLVKAVVSPELLR